MSAFAGRDEPEWMRTADLRYGGQSWEIEVELPPGPVDRALLDGLRARFEDEHEVLYGVRGQPGSPVEVRAVRLAALGATRGAAVVRRRRCRSCPTATRRGAMWLGGEAADVPVRSRASIGADAEAGPLLVDEYDTTVVVPDGWTVRRHLETGTLVLEREAAVAERDRRAGIDPITCRSSRTRSQSIADEMATTIIRTAHSTVVRDGMDFSSALCDAQGETVAQAVSVPFHLGSIPTAMESLLGHYGDRVRPGDVFIMNDPFDGGMHLQDIFIVKPVYLERGADRLGRDDRAPRRRRRPAAGLERVRQHRDLPGGPPHALAAVLRRGRAGRGGAQADRGEHAHPAHDVRRPRCPGCGLLGRRARAAGARRPPRARARSRGSCST